MYNNLSAEDENKYPCTNLLRSKSFYADLLMLFPVTSLALNRAVSHGLTPGTFQQAFPTIIRLALTTKSTPRLVKSRWLRYFVFLKALLHERNRERWRYRGSHRIFDSEIPLGKTEGVPGWKSSLSARTNWILTELNGQGDQSLSSSLSATTLYRPISVSFSKNGRIFGIKESCRGKIAASSTTVWFALSSSSLGPIEKCSRFILHS